MVDEELHNYDEAVCKFFAVDRGHKQVHILMHSILHILVRDSKFFSQHDYNFPNKSYNIQLYSLYSTLEIKLNNAYVFELMFKYFVGYPQPCVQMQYTWKSCTVTALIIIYVMYSFYINKLVVFLLAWRDSARGQKQKEEKEKTEAAVIQT